MDGKSFVVDELESSSKLLDKRNGELARLGARLEDLAARMDQFACTGGVAVAAPGEIARTAFTR